MTQDGSGVPAIQRKRTSHVLIACVLLFALSNLLVEPIGMARSRVFIPEVFYFACSGLVGAQVALLAIWCVLAPISPSKRLVAAVTTGTLLLGAFGVGFLVRVDPGRFDITAWFTEMLLALLCLPLVLIAMQMPLWAARYWLHWRVAPFGDDCPKPGGHHFRVRDLLIATGVVAVAFSAVQLAAPLSMKSATFLVSTVVIALVCAGISLISTVPIVLVALGARRFAWVIPLLLLWGTAAIYGTIRAFVTFAAVGPFMRGRDLAAMASAYFVCLAACMLLARWLGWRLRWGSRPRQKLGEQS